MDKSLPCLNYRPRELRPIKEICNGRNEHAEVAHLRTLIRATEGATEPIEGA